MATSPLERVTNLLTLLLESRRALTLREIADELAGMYPPGHVARRGAFERDKALLRDIGVPIETEVLGGDQAGETAYRIDRDRYELRGLELDDDERHALQVAVATIRSDTGQEGVWKLGGSVLPSSPVVTNVPHFAALPALRSAAGMHTSVAFDYRGAARRLDPYGLLLREGFWYVIGHDHGHGEIRTYRVDRIEGGVDIIEGSTFVRPAGFDPLTVLPHDAKTIGVDDERRSATVRVFGPLAEVVGRELGADAEIERGDGHITFTVPCTNLEAFRSWLFGLGEHAEVVGPPQVRAEIVTWLRSCVQREEAAR